VCCVGRSLRVRINGRIMSDGGGGSINLDDNGNQDDNYVDSVFEAIVVIWIVRVVGSRSTQMKMENKMHSKEEASKSMVEEQQNTIRSTPIHK